MKNNKENNKGIGSFFSYINNDSEKLTGKPNHFKPDNKMLFYNGRQAIKYIIESIKLENTITTLWIPEYYCKHVTFWLEQCYSNIKMYHADPVDFTSPINLVDFADDGDIVLVQNFWGASSCNTIKGDKSIITIEDHSHGWLSDACTNSKADYCIASLRKSVPAPLGGIAWSPSGKPINNKVQISKSTSFSSIWTDITEAMKLKALYESSSIIDEDIKLKSLELINSTEKRMHTNYDITHLTEKHEKIIESYLDIDFTAFKSENKTYIDALLKPSNNYKVVSSKHALFGLILFLKTKTHMDKLRSYLIKNDIYPSQLWPENNSSYGYYLNIHIDYRYNNKSMIYITSVLNTFNDIL